MGHLTAARVLLGPLMLLQGLHLRRVIPKLPEPPGERAGEAGAGLPLRLLILGDSAAAGVGAATQSEALCGQLISRISPHYRVAWELRARTGATTASTLRHLSRLPQAAYDVIVISLGVNDLTSGQDLSGWLQQQAQLIELLQTRFDAGLLLFSSLPPMHLFPGLPQPLRWYLGQQARHFNGGLQTLLRTHERCLLVSVDLARDPKRLLEQGIAADGFHPGPAFYSAWAEHLAEQLLGRWPLRRALSGRVLGAAASA
jgi:lysophospholipase L1-like esterase